MPSTSEDGDKSKLSYTVSEFMLVQPMECAL